MSLLSTIGKAASVVGNLTDPIGSVVDNAIGIDTTPGYSASNVIKTQAGNLLGGSGGSSNNTSSASNSNPQVADNSAAPSGAYSATNGSNGIDPTTGYSYNFLTQLANGQLGNLDQQAQVGNQNILDAYNTQVNALNGSKALTDRNYQDTSNQTLQNYVGARGNEQASVGQQANSLQRLLGAHGYQGSANQAAAYAAALQGTAANNALQGDYAQNQQALDTNYGDYNNQFQNSLAQLGNQKQQQLNALQAQVDTNKSNLLQQLAGISSANGGNTTNYLNQINGLGSAITSLGQQYSNPVLQATAPVYQAPTLQSYDAPTQSSAQVSNNAAASNVSPYLSVLLGAQQDKNNLNNLPQ